MAKDTLKKRIEEQGSLTQDEQDALLSLIGGRCRRPTIDALRRRIALPLSLWHNYGIFGRVMFNEDGQTVCYYAGQDYPTEIAAIRKLILEC